MLNGTTAGHILAKSEMCSSLVVIIGVGVEDPTQVGFTERDVMAEAFSANRADQPLRVPFLRSMNFASSPLPPV